MAALMASIALVGAALTGAESGQLPLERAILSKSPVLYWPLSQANPDHYREPR